MNLTKNFALQEFTFSPTANANGINNTPSAPAVKNLKALCEHVLQPLRDALGVPVKITSGFRCAALNAKLKGSSKNSQHMTGCAADIIVPSVNLKTVYDFIKNNFEYDQLLFEYASDGSRWIHVSYVQGYNRKHHADNYKAY